MPQCLFRTRCAFPLTYQACFLHRSLFTARRDIPLSRLRWFLKNSLGPSSPVSPYIGTVVDIHEV